MKRINNIEFVPADFVRAVFLISLIVVLTSCATLTDTVEGTATEEDLKTVPLTQELTSLDLELEVPDGWVAMNVSRAQQEQEVVGMFKHPETGARLAVYKPAGVLTVKRVRQEADRYAEIRLPGAVVSDGPFSLGWTALSPMYIRYEGVEYRRGDLVNRHAYCGYNLARGISNYVLIMDVDEQHADWSKPQFISIIKEF